MSNEPIIAAPGTRLAATGTALALHEWSHGAMEGPPLHVHHGGDEAWYVLEGTLRFHFADRRFDAGPGTAVFVPAGVAHTFGNAGTGNVRYLIALSAEILELIDTLHAGDASADQAAIYRRYDSEILE